MRYTCARAITPREIGHRRSEEPLGWDIVSGVGITALAVAAARAVDTGRDDPEIDRMSDEFTVDFRSMSHYFIGTLEG